VRSERGFTLIEMLVALVIGMIVVSQMYILTRAVGHDTTKQQMETEAMQRARVGIELLTADFERAGLNTSPNPARDPDSMVNPGETGSTNQLAYNRPAIVHLNRTDTANDALLLVGSFLSSNTYQATIDGSGTRVVLTTSDAFATADDCKSEFNPGYAFAHVLAPNGQTADAGIATAEPEPSSCTTNCACKITLEYGELFVDGPSAFASGQLVHVAANQAALYQVKTIGAGSGARDALIRQFVDFDSGSTCTAAALEATADATSAKIIADYVTDFQVWFRNVYKDAADALDPTSAVNGEAAKPRFFTTATAGARVLPCDRGVGFGATASDCPSAESTHFACAVTPSDNAFGPEHVRSAVIRLGVRTEKTDQEVMKNTSDSDWAALESREPENDSDRILRYNVASPPVVSGVKQDVGAYKVRTVVTEVMLPNLAARMASFKRVIAW
jgi:prepilin-type N-terminal cleavage/methylation domain-containing protein